MELPLQFDGGSTQFPSTATCAICGAAIGETLGFTRLTVGSQADNDATARAYFGLWFHGPHPLTGRIADGRQEVAMDNACAHLDVVRGHQWPQACVVFCSAKCLRVFFNQVVNEFEQSIAQAEAAFQLRKRADTSA